jgi:hypothetical protein
LRINDDAKFTDFSGPLPSTPSSKIRPRSLSGSRSQGLTLGTDQPGRGARKRRVEDCIAIYVNELCREGALAAGVTGTLTWEREDDTAASVVFRTEEAALILCFHDQRGAEDREVSARLGWPQRQALALSIALKPKGMWRRTFDRLRGTAVAAESIATAAQVAHWTRLLRRLERRQRRTQQA